MVARRVARHGRWFYWVILLLGGLTMALALPGLWGGLQYSFRGVRASGKVIEFHTTTARSVSIVAQVEVTLPDAAPFRWEVEDATHSQEWVVGGTVPLLCTHIYADHVSCMVDAWRERYLPPLLVLAAGAGMLMWSLKSVRALPTPQRSAASVTAPPLRQEGARDDDAAREKEQLRLSQKWRYVWLDDAPCERLAFDGHDDVGTPPDQCQCGAALGELHMLGGDVAAPTDAAELGCDSEHCPKCSKRGAPVHLAGCRHTKRGLSPRFTLGKQ